MRVFLDTNVIVSAFATRGLCADLLRLVLAEHDLVVGEVVLTELERVLRIKLRVPEDTVEAVLALLREQDLVPSPSAPSPLPVEDPADAWVLASAVEAEADVLVTGDQDLLRVASDAPLLILTPRQLWERLRRP